MKREIGSEFWDIPLSHHKNNAFPPNARWFISGTAALEFILKDLLSKRSIKKAALPSWCCSCMISPFLNNNIEVEFYPVYISKTKKLVCDYSTSETCDVTLVMMYFGYSSHETIGVPQGIVIQDITHSIFTHNRAISDYCFGSLRKWAGFYTGGFAWSQESWSIDQSFPPPDEDFIYFRRKAMIDKALYIANRTDSKAYLNDYTAAEEILDSCGIMSAAYEDIVCAQHLDINYIQKRRRENASLLISELQDLSIFHNVSINDCPLFVPIILPPKDRAALQHHLISNGIFCPTHWPISTLHRLDSRTSFLYHHELSIVCDQRYGIDDMKRILDAIWHFYRNRNEDL